MVELLCGEMARAFADTGTPLPPWRQHAAMLSKWQPRRSEEVEVSAARLNNEAGLRAPLEALQHAGGGGDGGLGPLGVGRRKVAPLTGPATIAQRLAMLGVQAPSRVSPVAEGLEGPASEWSSTSLDNGSEHRRRGGGGGSGRSASASASGSGGGPEGSQDSASLHLDSAGEEEGCSSGLPARVWPLAKAHSAHLAVAKPAAVTVTAAAGTGMGGDGSSATTPLHADRRHIWAGIKRAVAALPQRRWGRGAVQRWLALTGSGGSTGPCATASLQNTPPPPPHPPPPPRACRNTWA